MNVFKKVILLLLLVLLLILSKGNGAAQVVDHSGTTGTLQAKWDQALAAGLKQNKSFWLAYSVDRLVDENVYFISSIKLTGCIRTSTFPTFKGIPLGKLFYGKNVEILKPNPKSRKEQVKKVKKEVAVLFLFKPGSGKEPAEIRQNNLSLPFDSNGAPIYWLGKTNDNNSLLLLKGIFAAVNGDKAKRRLLSAIGYHSNSRQIIPFLAKVVDSLETDTVRGKAAGELGDQDNPSAIDILLNIAQKDHSLEVRRKAVNALEDLDFPAAVHALIDIAKTANNSYIRQRAINSLGDIGSKKAADVLNNIVFKDRDINVQRRAVYAFEDLPGKNGVPYLINIAKTHPKPYIRKKALDCLSDIKDPRAFEAIKAVAKEN